MKYQDVFPRKQSLLVVVHIADEIQALRNVQIALDQGADGVFLIDHGGCRELSTASFVHRACPTAWLGVNRLGCSATTAFNDLPAHIQGVWTDDARLDEGKDFQDKAEAVNQARARTGWEGLYFGGVAFKYQRPVLDLEAAARVATGYLDVICTSGPGTGRAASPEKIQRMKSAAALPVAIASGVTPENVTDYPTADCFLVATGISSSFHELDPARVRALVDRLQR